MKKAILLNLILFPALAFAQFSTPDSFQISVHYITMDQGDWCDGQWVQGPAYCNLFNWQAPDTANTPATLTGYRIYKDDEFFLATANTDADTAGMYPDVAFYVTALYENPAGESGPSNVVVIEDLPMGTDEEVGAGQISIWFDPVQQVLTIRGAEQARALWVYDVNGKLVVALDDVPTQLPLKGIKGVFWVHIIDENGSVYNKALFLAE